MEFWKSKLAGPHGTVHNPEIKSRVPAAEQVMVLVRRDLSSAGVPFFVPLLRLRHGPYFNRR